MSASHARSERSLGIEIAAGTLTLLVNVLAHRVVPPRLQTLAGVVTGGLAIVMARQLGMSWGELGLSPRDAPRGVLLGMVAAAVVGAATAAGPLIPAARRFYLDGRIVDASLTRMLHEVFVRIPLGTAVPEELVFRGALLGLFSRRRSFRTAAVASSVLFGAWHILPTLDRIGSNPGTRGAQGDHLRIAAVVIAVCSTTTAAGLGFSWLRFRSRSVVAPMLAHIAPNAAGFLGGWVVSRLISPSKVNDQRSAARSV